MAVKIRLRRMGKNKRPFYRVVVADVRRSNQGRFIESLGWYDPKSHGVNFRLDLQRADHWLKRGARPSETVRSLLKKARTSPAVQPTAADSAPQETEPAAATAETVTSSSQPTENTNQPGQESDKS